MAVSEEEQDAALVSRMENAGGGSAQAGCPEQRDF